MRGTLTAEDAAILARIPYVMRDTLISGDRRDASIMNEMTLVALIEWSEAIGVTLALL